MRQDGVVVLVNVDADAHEALISSTNHIRFSDDYGATWTASDKCLSGSDVTGSNTIGEPYLMDVSNGDLLLMLGRGWTASPNGGTWFCRSTDGGETWTAAAQITISGIVGDANYLNAIDDHFNYNGATYLSGRISTDILQSNCKSVLIKSTDNGANWSWVADVSTAGLTNEIGIEYLGNNRIIAVMRGSAASEPSYRSFSNDMGATWSTPENTAGIIFNGGRHRLMTGAHWRGETNWWTDPVLIMEGFLTAYGRYPAVWVSTDAGITWHLPFAIDAVTGDSGYGDIFYNPNTSQYVNMTYYGETAAADIKQYNLTIGGI